MGWGLLEKGATLKCLSGKVRELTDESLQLVEVRGKQHALPKTCTRK